MILRLDKLEMIKRMKKVLLGTNTQQGFCPSPNPPNPTIFPIKTI